MRTNLPVTGNEYVLQDGATLVSRTDPRGLIVEVNDDFVEASGFTREELIGAPHNIVRHPDMPVEAFADFWATLKAGRPWRGMVKNRRKNGDHYWVEANATPIYENDRLVGYMSVRTRPTSRQVDEAERVYRLFREKASGSLRIEQGAIVRDSWLRRIDTARNMSVRGRLMALLGALAAGSVFIGVLSLHFMDQAWARNTVGGLLLAGIPVALALGWRLARDITAPLAQATAAFRCFAQGKHDTRVDISRDDEIGRVLQGLASMQIRAGFEMQETRHVAQQALRVRCALDNVGANVMIADNARRIIYMNDAVQKMMADAEADLRRDLPDFTASKLLGGSMDAFHRNPGHQKRLLEALRERYSTRIRVGGRTFSLAATPVIDAAGQRLGSVVEWNDITAEVAVQEEIAAIVDAAAVGDFSRRLDMRGKSGFFQQLGDGLNKLLDTASGALDEVVGMLGALAEGDLTRTIEGDYQGTLARMRDDANRTVAQLSDIVARIRTGSDAINTAAMEISAGNDDLSRRTEQQAASLEETASSMEELTSTVRQNADNARQANQLAIGAADVARQGGQVVGQVVTTMSAINESSRKVADIISVIDGIAFQTNILALNAAVEAARAGEQGRGFAVVASEVRSLAQRSAGAAKEIKQLITESVEHVGAGTSLVDRAGRTMQEIVASVQRMTDFIADISAASQEQTAGIEQINQAITQMDEGTQQNAALVEEATASARGLEQQAAELVETVAAFRLRQDGSRLARVTPITLKKAAND